MQITKADITASPKTSSSNDSSPFHETQIHLYAEQLVVLPRYDSAPDLMALPRLLSTTHRPARCRSRPQ